MDFIKDHAEAIFGGIASGAAVMIPFIVRMILSAIKNQQVQAMLPGIVKGAVEIVSTVSKQTNNKADDKVASVLELVADEMHKAGLPVNEKTIGRASQIAASIEANASALSVAKDDKEKHEIIAKLLAKGGHGAVAAAVVKAKKAGAK